MFFKGEQKANREVWCRLNQAFFIFSSEPLNGCRILENLLVLETMLELNAKTREILGKKVKALRKKGVIPAVVYGEKVKSMPLEVGYKEFESIYFEVYEP